MSVFALAAQPLYGVGDAAVANAAAPATYKVSSVYDADCSDFLCNSLQGAIDAASAGDVINIIGNLSIHSQVTVDKAVTINGKNPGNGYVAVLWGEFNKTGNDNNAVIGLRAPALIQNIIIDGKKRQLHGVNAWHTNGDATVWDTTLRNLGMSGLNVGEQARVVAGNLTTSNNGWNAIDVDKDGSWFKLAGINHFGEKIDVPVIYMDNRAVSYVHIDTPGLYVYVDNTRDLLAPGENRSGDRAYFLASDYPAPAVLSVVLDKIITIDGVNYTSANMNGGVLNVTFTTDKPLAAGSQIGFAIPGFAGPPATGWTKVQLVDAGTNTYVAHMSLLDRTDTSAHPTDYKDFFKGKTMQDVRLYFRTVGSFGNANSVYYLKDGSLGKSGDFYRFTLDNTAPVVTGDETGVAAGAGAIQSGFVDEDGDDSGNVYEWVQTAGPGVQISDRNVLNPQFVPTVTGDYEFELIAKDPVGNETHKTFLFTYTEPVVTVLPTNEPANTGGNTALSGQSQSQGSSVDVDAGNTVDQAVLGVTDDTADEQLADGAIGGLSNKGASDSRVGDAAVEGASDVKKAGGLAWYWYLVIAAAVGVFWWIAAAIRRRRAEQNIL